MIILKMSVFISSILTSGIILLSSASEQSIRSLVDTVGFAHTIKQIEAVVKLSESLEADFLVKEDINFPNPWIAGISLNDDYIYTGQVYVHGMHNFKAKCVILFGVAHKAWKLGVENKLIFDQFEY